MYYPIERLDRFYRNYTRNEDFNFINLKMELSRICKNEFETYRFVDINNILQQKIDMLLRQGAIKRIKTLLNRPRIKKFIEEHQWIIDPKTDTQNARKLAEIFYSQNKEAYELASKYTVEFMKIARDLNNNKTNEQGVDEPSRD